MERILIIGSAGQLGTELSFKLIDLYGRSNIVRADIKEPGQIDDPDNYVQLDACQGPAIEHIVMDQNITQVYHLAAVLSARAESNPRASWDLNMISLLNILELGRYGKVKKIYWPSSIAVFGPGTPRQETPQHTIMDPDTVYGISKLAGERWCEYYHRKYDVDVRSLRYPGLIGYRSLPGGGTTDYAVDIFHKAIHDQPFECFLEEDAALPMMYMDDAVRGTIELMEAPSEKIRVRSSYNISAISFTPQELTNAVKLHYPSLKVDYKPDFRQKIADSWPDNIDDSAARDDWGWDHKFDLERMTTDMIENLSALIVSDKS